ncbi:MAG: UDP-N-acetylmuramate dehydrogenase [Porphyromonas sp.]|nr:UDP-N-acetylmuramate dehydrogenase [Porphyromonas sp.]
MEILQNYPLKEHHTFAIEAQTEWWINFDSAQDLQLLARDEFFASNPFFCIGSGSNILFVDNYKGIILHCTNQDLEEIRRGEESAVVRVGAGMVWDEVVQKTLGRNLYGLENLSYIPGTAGASAVQNIGAYGVESCQFIEAVETVDLLTGEQKIFSNEECCFAYRYSIFKEKPYRSKVITHVHYKLATEPRVNTTYASLQQSFASGEVVTPQLVRDRVIAIRQSKLPDPEQLPNAGSFFMNPVVTKEVFERLIELYPSMPHYTAEKSGLVKLAAGWLIDQCGLKGYREGNVGVHNQQALVLVNYGGASGREVVNFAQMIAHRVNEKFDIKLSPEVLYVL